MNNFYERELLTQKNVYEIKNIIKNCLWEDGLRSTVGMTKKTKNNLEICDSNIVKQVTDFIMSFLDLDEEFAKKCLPLTSTSLIISKMTSGGYYNPHHDRGNLGDYSTTVFLSDPNEYGGGELCICVDGEEKKFKPSLGTAVTYNTGLMHRVNKVTFGERIVAVFWTKSMFSDPFIRKIYSEISRVRDSLPRQEQYSSFSEAYEDNEFILQGILDDIIRRYMGRI